MQKLQENLKKQYNLLQKIQEVLNSNFVNEYN
jgi:hypothetical protein